MRTSENLLGILAGVSAGDAVAIDRLLPLVYDELRRAAVRSLARERCDHTLQPTALVHEAYLRLVGQNGAHWRSAAHFLAVAAQIIRRVLVDHARARACRKRGGHWDERPLDAVALAAPQPTADLLDLHEALLKLSLTDPRKAQVVEMRFFGGLTVEEVADVLDVNTRSVERDWQYARAWLFRELAKGDTSLGGGGAGRGT